MDNVLGALFQDIADAIRLKTGGTDTMKPAEFPTRIATIPIGGVNGSGEWVGNAGEFIPTSETAVVEHGLGAVPDIVIITYNDSNALSTSLNKMVLLAAVAYSSNVLNNVTMKAANQTPAYGFSSSIHANTKMLFPGVANAPLENLTSSSAVGICNATFTTVTFGSTSFNAKLAANGKGYRWYAFARK